MAIAELPNLTPVMPDRCPDTTGAFRTPLYNRETSDQTDSFTAVVEPLPNHVLDVAKREIIKQERVQDVGYLIRFLVTFEGGHQYEEQRFMSQKQRFEAGVSFTTPWCTPIGGFNTEVQKDLAKQGMNSDLVGPPKIPWDKLPQFFNYVQLSRDAAAQVILFKDAASEGLFQDNQVMLTGYSRGAMVGFGVLAYSNKENIKVPFFDFIDPCLVRSPRAEDFNPTHLKTYFYMMNEFLTALRAWGQHPLEDRVDLRQTINLDPRTVLGHYATGLALFEGQTGQLLPHVPKDAEGLIRLYDGSLFNQGALLKRGLQNHPRIQWVDRRGFHFSGMDPQVRKSSAARIALAQMGYSEHRPIYTIDFTNALELQPA